MSDELLLQESGCVGNAYHGFICSDTQYPKVVREIITIGNFTSINVVSLAALLAAAFWLCSLRMQRDLTKSFMMPIAAPFSVLIVIEMIHVWLITYGREPDDQVILTLRESEKFLNNVGHYTLVYSIMVYLCHATASARSASRQIGIVARYYSYSAWYVVVLLTFTILCAGLFPPIPMKLSEVIDILISVLAVIGYIADIFCFFFAATAFCMCYPQPTGISAEDQAQEVNHSRLGGALLYAVTILPGLLLRGVILIPLSNSTKNVLISTFLLIRFLLPMLVFLNAFLFLPSYRKGVGVFCMCYSCCRERQPAIRQIHYANDPTPGTFSNIEHGNYQQPHQTVHM